MQTFLSIKVCRPEKKNERIHFGVTHSTIERTTTTSAATKECIKITLSKRFNYNLFTEASNASKYNKRNINQK